MTLSPETGNLTFLPLVNHNAWEVALRDISLGEDVLDFENAKAVIDLSKWPFTVLSSPASSQLCAALPLLIGPPRSSTC